MPELMSQEEFAFLADVDRLGAEGVELQEIAQQKGIHPSTITFRVNRRGLAARKFTRIIDRRTGRTLEQLVADGEIVVSDSPADAVSAASEAAADLAVAGGAR
jgi:hypothetical protein